MGVCARKEIMPVLLTGAAGFIGYHVGEALLGRGERVVGVDNLTDYYDPNLKQARLERLRGRSGFSFHRIDLSDRKAVFELVDGEPEIDRVVHMAAQPGVRYSLENPYAYVDANVMGELVVLEACRRLPDFKHLVYASSSSVYGGNRQLPFAVDDPVDHPVSLYAATKRAGELIVQCYAHLYRLPATGLRFFTVYGPWGRPDMSAYIFTRSISKASRSGFSIRATCGATSPTSTTSWPACWRRSTTHPKAIRGRRTGSTTWATTVPRTSCTSSRF